MSQDYVFLEGDRNAPVLVVTEPPDDEAFDRRETLTTAERRFFMHVADSYGFSPEDFCYVPCSIPMPENCVGDKDQGEHLMEDREDFLEILRGCNPQMILAMGKHALRQLTGRPAQIGKARGQVHHIGDFAPVVPLTGIRQCLWFPENIDLFVTDFNIVSTVADNDYDPSVLNRITEENTDYRWTLDLREWLANKPRFMAVDTETTGLRWTRGDRVLTVQLTRRPGQADVIPVDLAAAKLVWPQRSERNLKKDIARVKDQLKTLLTDPNIRKIGHNFKFDQHHVRESLGYSIKGWFADTQQLAFVVDDNMREKSLDECTRRWCPEMAGYADEYNRTADKSNMLGELEKDRDKFLRYAGGDTDANFRVAATLVRLAKEDPAQWRNYLYVQLPALLGFANVIEPNGINVDLTQLGQLEIEVESEADRLHNRILGQIPRDLRRKHLKQGISLSRPAFKIEALFSDEGLGLQPLFYTKSTRHKPPAERVPTVGKDHLIYFAHEPLVDGMLKWAKLDKMRGTYVGKEFDPEKGGPTGFWKHVVRAGDTTKIHPSFFLHRTSTGRTASADPNAQNFPKRGDLAKSFRSIFTAPPGWKIIEADLSQAELRIAACQANEETMIRLYNEGVDIHMNTAASVARMPVQFFIDNKKSDDYLIDRADEFPGSGQYLRSLGSNERQMKTVADFIALQRFRAKAVNFGFLYGMQWRKFMIYAKTDYGLDYTEEESRETRELFFGSYPGLVEWHYEMEREVFEHGYVRALHGAMRRLPSIYSTRRSVQQESVRQAINSPIQRFASDLGTMALARLCRDCPDFIKPIAFIHDALLMYVRDDMVQEAAQNIRFYMESNPLQQWFGLDLPVPIIADVAVGDRLSAMEEISVPSTMPDWYNEELDMEPEKAYLYL